MRRPVLDRLSVSDLMNFWVEDPNQPSHIAIAAVLELPPGASVGNVREDLIARLPRAPELTKRVRWTRFGQGRPLLVDDRRFDPRRHVTVRGAQPLDVESRFAELAVQIAMEPLDRDRPLWRAALIPDPGGLRVGLVLVIHHALADGIRAVVLASQLFDSSPHIADHEEDPQPHAEVEPTAIQLVTDNARAKWSTARYAVGLLRRPRKPRGGWSQLRTVGRNLSKRAPRLVIDGPVGPRRHLEIIHVPMDALRVAAHLHRATINDLVLTAVGGGMRSLILANGGEPEGVVLRVGVPVGAHTGVRNAGGTMPLEAAVPVGALDAPETLACVTADMRAKKSELDRDYAGLLTSPLMPAALVRLVVSLARRSRSQLINLYVTNVPGPPEHLWLGSARVTAPVPIAPLMAGGRICVAALSYAGELAVSVHTDADLPHTDSLASGIRETLVALGAEVDVPSGDACTTPR